MGERLTNAVRAMMIEAGIVGQFDIHQGAATSYGFVGKPDEGEDMRVTVIITPVNVAARVWIETDDEPPSAIERPLRIGN